MSKFQRFLRWSQIVAVLAVFGLHGAAKAELPTVSSVDLERYMGTWYEIARYPNSFQKDCVAVKAEYQLKKNGKLKVVNSCRIKTLDGKLNVANGTGRVADKKTNSKLKVSFAPFGLFAGNYWIIALDPNYQWAVVSEPKQDYLWILSRSVTLDPQVFLEIQEYLEGLNFDLSKLILTGQPSTPY